jgi:hypothetical protein
MDATANFSLRFARASDSNVETTDWLLSRQTLQRISTGISLISLTLGFWVFATLIFETLLAGPAAPSGDAPLPPDLSESVMRPLAKLPPKLQVECWRLVSRVTENRRILWSRAS